MVVFYTFYFTNNIYYAQLFIAVIVNAMEADSKNRNKFREKEERRDDLNRIRNDIKNLENKLDSFHARFMQNRLDLEKKKLLRLKKRTLL